MKYKSNLLDPDLSEHFKLRTPPLQLMGHDIPSDPDFGDVGSWSHDESAILYSIAKSVPAGIWVDIGARLGWTAAHVAEAGHLVWAVDPELKQDAFYHRFRENTNRWKLEIVWHPEPVAEFWSWVGWPYRFGGFVIDGCHDSPEPLNDAMGAHAHAKPDCIIMFHDFQGWPVRDGVRWLMDHEPGCPAVADDESDEVLHDCGECTCGRGYRCRVYWTPNQVACCWRGHADWRPPDHVADPSIDWRPYKDQMTDFAAYWEMCG